MSSSARDFTKHLRETLEIDGNILTLEKAWNMSDEPDLPTSIDEGLDFFIRPNNGDVLLAVGKYSAPTNGSEWSTWRGKRIRFRAIFLRNDQLHAVTFYRMSKRQRRVSTWG